MHITQHILSDRVAFLFASLRLSLPFLLTEFYLLKLVDFKSRKSVKLKRNTIHKIPVSPFR